MPGSNSIRGDQSIIFADNLSFDGTQRAGAMNTDGQLFIGATASDRANNGGHVRIGAITSPLGTLTIGYSEPNITLDLVGGGMGIDTFTTNVAGPVSPDGGGAVDVTGTSIFSDGTVANTFTLDVQATAYTLLVGRGANTSVAEIGPGANYTVFQGNTGTDPSFNTNLTLNDTNAGLTQGVITWGQRT